MKLFKSLLLFTLLLLQISNCFAVDVVRWNNGNINTDKRRDYKVELIVQALEKTIPLYGPYRLIETNKALVPQRALQLVQDGQLINIFMAVTSPEWEKKTIPIRIPVRRGILNYRLLAINNGNLAEFDSVKTSKDLKKHTVGLRRGWATVGLMENYDFSILQTTTLGGLYQVLSRYEVDYIPRGINEIFDEVDVQHTSNKDLIIEPTIALHTIAPYYIFVSPKEKRLAKRLEAGLEMMIADNSLKVLFDKYYADKIIQSRLGERKVIQIDNLNLSPETPIGRKELWFEYDAKK